MLRGYDVNALTNGVSASEVKDMRITVFGSTGKAGKEVIKQALERGFSIAAFARSPQKMGLAHPNLTVIHGELTDLASLETAIRGADCVISLLGPSGKVQDTALSDGVRRIISIMETCGVRRLIQISTPSVADSKDGKDFIFGLMVALVKRSVPGSYAEIVRIGQAVRASKLEWTLVRVPLLNEKALTKKIRMGFLGQRIVKTSLSRADLAWFMLEQVDSRTLIQEAPVISN